MITADVFLEYSGKRGLLWSSVQFSTPPQVGDIISLYEKDTDRIIQQVRIIEEPQ